MLDKNEINEKQKIEETEYMIPSIRVLYSKINESNDWSIGFNFLHEAMILGKDEVEIYLEQRKSNGVITNIEQERKNIAGQIFPKLFIWVFLKCKESDLIPNDYYITSKPNSVKDYKDSFLISIDGETQKPDCDLLIYNNSISKFIIFSLKTSLRERMGQTYKWKLLLEIATSENSIKEKFKIVYKDNKKPLIYFATVNFYDEINNPQIRGALKFFDKAFIAKPIQSEFIANLSDLVSLLK